jgi:hypothetical protein
VEGVLPSRIEPRPARHFKGKFKYTCQPQPHKLSLCESGQTPLAPALHFYSTRKPDRSGKRTANYFSEVIMLLKRTLPALLLGLALATAGCESLGLGGDRDNNNDDTLPPRHDKISTRDRGDYDGTTMKYPADFDNGIPTGARLAREIDTNGGVGYKAAHDGKLYLYDVDSKRVTWSGSVRDGERFNIDSHDGRATVNNQSVLDRDLNPDHRYRLYFVEASRDTSNSSSSSRSNDRYNDDR